MHAGTGAARWWSIGGALVGMFVQTSSMLTVAAIGAVSLWRNGIAIADLRMPKEDRLGSS